MEKRTKTLLYRRSILVLLMLACAILQNTSLPFAGGSFRIWLLLPLVVVAAMFEKETVGFLTGLFAGCLWDTSAASADGVKALFFALVGGVCGLLIRYIMRNTLSAALVLTTAVSLFFTLGHWFTNVVLLQAGSTLRTLFVFYLPQTVLTILTAPLFYFLIRALEKRFRLPGDAR